jgi:protein required for attachment to host cells
MTLSTDHGNRHFLVVVADESKAIVYRRTSLSGPLQETTTFENEAARLKTGEIIADKGGRSFDSHGHGRHTMANEKADPKKHLAEQFARDIAEHIKTDVHTGSCRGYALVAAPQFLGLLRAELARHTPMEPYATVDKHVVGQAEAVIEKLLSQAAAP